MDNDVRDFRKVEAYSIFDSKGQIYNSPFFLGDKMIAIRQLHMMVHDKESMISKYPEDYYLYRVGVFDISTGIMDGENKEMICRAVDLIEKKGGKK